MATTLDDFVHPPVNFDPGPEYGSEARKYQGIPGIERAPNGRLWAVWYAGKEHEDRYNYVVGATSDDDGETWSDLKFVIDPDGDGPMRTSDPCLWLDPNGRLWLFWWLNGPGELATVTMAMTTDNPDAEEPEWSEPRVICTGVMINKPIVTREGDWLLPTAIWHTDYSNRIMVSADEGKTWSLQGAANVPDPAHRNCDEPMLLERTDGSLMLLVRTMYGIGRSISEDKGKSWNPVEPYLHDTTSRFFIRRLASGNVLLVKHGPVEWDPTQSFRQQIGRSRLTAYLSEDDGETWQGGLLLDERHSVSYPDGTQGPDGTIYIIYDWNRADEKHILMATFGEEDVLAQEPISDRARLRVLVNQATGVNPKPWLRDGRFLGLRSHANEASLQVSPVAELETGSGEIRLLERGHFIFTDRDYVVANLPEALSGRRFVFSSIDHTEALCRAPGIVYVLTPAPDRNSDSVEKELLVQGFEKVAVREHVLFLFPDSGEAEGNRAHARSAEACTVYQKRVAVNESIEFGKWGVLVF